jgi:mRNA interferase MazF
VRSIVLADLGGKVRPAVVLTREVILPKLTNVTLAPITSTIRGISTEVSVGPDNGIDHDSVISCDNIQTVPKSAVISHVGFLSPQQEAALTEAILVAFDLY